MASIRRSARIRQKVQQRDYTGISGTEVFASLQEDFEKNLRELAAEAPADDESDGGNSEAPENDKESGNSEMACAQAAFELEAQCSDCDDKMKQAVDTPGPLKDFIVESDSESGVESPAHYKSYSDVENEELEASVAEKNRELEIVECKIHTCARATD